MFRNTIHLFGLLWVVLLTCTQTPALAAERKSFVYIQGDKTTPFYVKVNETMQPRYGKNYCIIPKLEPGKLEVEILYQQNKYPPQTYIFDVPENGSRSFLLSKKDTAYALYDLETKTYIASTIKQKQ